MITEIVDKLAKDPTKLPVVYMFPQNEAPPSPTHEERCFAELADF